MSVVILFNLKLLAYSGTLLMLQGVCSFWLNDCNEAFSLKRSSWLWCSSL